MYLHSTTHAIAVQGASDYTRALRESTSARTLFLSGYTVGKPIRILDVQRCFVGISAEIVFEERDIATNPRHLFDETASYVNKQLTNFFFYHSPSDRYHLFNLQAVRLIAIHYPTYFPTKVSTDTHIWLQQNWPMWADGKDENCIRYGLLSGFPLEAVVRFAQHKRTGQRLPIEQVVHSPVTNLSYFGFEVEKDIAYMSQLDEIFRESKIKW
ncbi:MAG: hypothetical protein NVS2B12_14190 [Ktedonobacteraceae bacterium]